MAGKEPALGAEKRQAGGGPQTGHNSHPCACWQEVQQDTLRADRSLGWGPSAGRSQGENEALRGQGRGAEGSGQGWEEGHVPDGPLDWMSVPPLSPQIHASCQHLPELSGEPWDSAQS